MSTIHNHRVILFLGTLLLVSVAVFVGVERGMAQDRQSVLLPLTPESREQVIAGAFVDTLERRHIARPTLDQSHSKEALRIYIRKLDPRKLHFYQSDIDEFKAKYELRLIELLKQNPSDVGPAFDIYNRYLVRLRERGGMIQQILSHPMDFTIDEEYAFVRPSDFTLDENVIKARELQAFPRTTEEAYERWRKRLKSELLALRAAEKEPLNVDDPNPVERLQRRYDGLQRRMLYERYTEDTETLNDVRSRANGEVMELFLTAIAESLDPHSRYMSPETALSWRRMAGLQGIGVSLDIEDEYIVIERLIPGGPADRSGKLRPGDKIQGVGQGIDGTIEEIIGFKLSDVTPLISGPKNTVVRLEILPGGRGPAQIIEIVRDEVKLDHQTAQSEIFEVSKKADGNPYRIGFIDLPSFAFVHPSTDVRDILRNFVAENVDAVVLDVRNNGGGDLGEAITVSGLFLGEGVVVQTKNADTLRPHQRRGNTGINAEWTGPLVVMTSKNSGSATEIVVGAIKDYRRGLIVGDSSTRGKGTAQGGHNLGDQFGQGAGTLGMAMITVLGMYRPSGISTQGVGVEADIVLPSLTEVTVKVTAAELDNVLILQEIPPADFTPKQFVTPQIIAELRKRSEARVRENAEFARLQDRIALHRESEARRTTPLNEAKYREEMQRLNTDAWKSEDVRSRDQRIGRDFYVDEVLAITVDYLNVAEEFGIADKD